MCWAVGSASACEAECEAAATTMAVTCALGGLTESSCTIDGDAMTCTSCPAGCQDEIDKTYVACGGCGDFDSENAATATMLATWGCAGAAHTTPALFVALAAVANHFLN